MKSCYYFFKLFEKSLKRGTELSLSGVRKEKEVFYLNDFYDLLYEKENAMTQQGLDPPEYFEKEKYYTNGAGCEILSYNEDGETKFMFYDGRGSNVAGLDIFGNELYSNEYGPMGEILYTIDLSKISFGCVLYDEDLGSYIDESSGSKAPFENLSYSIFANTLTKKIRFGRNLHSNQQTASSVSWNWIMWMCGDSRTQEEFLDCALEVICGLDFDCMDGGGDGGGGGGGGNDECKNPKDNTLCSDVCKTIKDCESCCYKMFSKCVKKCKGGKDCIKMCEAEKDACLANCLGDIPS